MFMCTSSSEIDHWKPPASISASISSRPLRMASRSASVNTPTWASILAWAREPAISCRYMRWSKPTEAVKASTKASVGSVKRPVQGFSTVVSGVLCSLMAFCKTV